MSLKFIVTDLPPSVNVIYCRSQYSSIYLTKKVLAFKSRVCDVLSNMEIKCTNNRVKLEIHYTVTKNNIDIDNLNKVLLDSMNEIVYYDDNQVYELHCTKSIGANKETAVTVIILE